MNLPLLPDRPSRWIFFAAATVCLLFAWWTQHAWEDYWITFRSSKNLATGNGLVFTPGERLHTFTSPLGVLLPALCSLLTFNQSDIITLWLYRLISIAAFGIGLVFLFQTVKAMGWSVIAAAGLVAAVLLDAKSVDFTINGMETGLLIGFIGYAVWATFRNGDRDWIHLGCAWAGLMWTRPDSFLIIGLLSLGILLFNGAAESGRTRVQWIVTSLKAGGVCTVLYLPWFAGAWAYYGTPVPHTVTAKSGVETDPGSLTEWFQTLQGLPQKILEGSSSLDGAIMPAYVQTGGWPEWMVATTRILVLGAALIWVLPFLPGWLRAVSFTFGGLHLYLTVFPFFPFPWYQPGPMIFGWLCLAGVTRSLLTLGQSLQADPTYERRGRQLKYTLLAGLVAWFGLQAWIMTQATRQLRMEQQITANQVRKAIGLWLRDNAEPGDTVFMEPLGHIGYFSGLKTLDFPGLSSQEVTDAVQLLGTEWSTLIDYLNPTFVALRTFEANRYHNPLTWSGYEIVEVFDQRETVAALEDEGVYGLPYLELDSHFNLYRRTIQPRRMLDLSDQAVRTQPPVPFRDINGQQMLMLHAPGIMSFVVPEGAKSVMVKFGFPPDAYQGPRASDGAEFKVLWRQPGAFGTLLHVVLNPRDVPEDRGLQTYQLGLPDSFSTSEGELIFQCLSGMTTDQDWSCWAFPWISYE